MLDSVPLNDTVARDRINLTIALIRKLKASLQQFVEDGEQSAKDWERILELEKKGWVRRIFADE